MRIIAGYLKGCTFASPPGHRTHPMSDKIRGALFNVLGDIAGLDVLDAFAGSGAVGFEALSRGARSVFAIDVDQTAYETIISNARQLGLRGERFTAVRANCSSWSGRNPETLFDIVVVDPPYEAKRLNHRQVFKMLDNVRPGGLFVASLPPHDQPADRYAAAVNLRELLRKNYGDAQLVFYRRIS